MSVCSPLPLAVLLSSVGCDWQGEVALSLSKISAQGFGQEDSFPVGGDQVLLDGYSQLPTYLSTGLNISLGCVVTTIDTTSKVQVTATCNGVTRVYTGDAVLVTLPLGVLKANVVTFIPALPTAKQTAITRMGVG
jgi:polyamine oxidase